MITENDLQTLLRARVEKRRAKPPKTGPLEIDVQKQIADWLTTAEGWRRVNTDPPWLRGAAVQEKGIADDLYIRYGAQCKRLDVVAAQAQVFWLECKQTAGTTGDKQLEWHIAEQGRGALTCIMGLHCVATFDGFRQWYNLKGLKRT